MSYLSRINVGGKKEGGRGGCRSSLKEEHSDRVMRVVSGAERKNGRRQLGREDMRALRKIGSDEILQ